MPEALLPIVFLISLIILKIMTREYRFALSARLAMTIMLLATGIAHFVYVKGMVLMIPEYIPFRPTIVYITGIIEIIAGILLLVPRYQKKAGVFIILFFVLLLPFNIYATMLHVDMEKASYGGDGLLYLWYRIPLQVFFIAWVYFSACRSSKKVTVSLIKDGCPNCSM